MCFPQLFISAIFAILCCITFGTLFGIEANNITTCSREQILDCYISPDDQYQKIYNVTFTSTICSGLKTITVSKTVYLADCEDLSDVPQTFFCRLEHKDDICFLDESKTVFIIFGIAMGSACGLISIISFILLMVYCFQIKMRD
uniref:Transmembrane protein n=1 Tax=Clandestinovirus TaxID=2831644 RepID=A0A8F8KR80_9VIRU|nr:transmembrane protein [Clandestinovirus]